MILSVSRRTDIPAYYTDWFFNRLSEGFVYVRNPMNYYQVSKIVLNPDIIDCIVFWTKDPTQIIERLDELKDYNYYFQITITSYDESLERNIRDKRKIIDAFQKLSKKIGKEKVIWRYDPIIINEELNIEYHTRKFEELASELSGYTDLCIISFMDPYKKTERNMKSIKPVNITKQMMYEIGSKLYEITKKYNLKINTCSEEIDLHEISIEHGKCIDDKLISKIIGQEIKIEKDKNQRKSCGCITSIDIGTYNTCSNGCIYCYANYSDISLKNNILKHDKNSPFLVGNIEPEDVIKDRKMISYKRGYEQTTFLY